MYIYNANNNNNNINNKHVVSLLSLSVTPESKRGSIAGLLQVVSISSY